MAWYEVDSLTITVGSIAWGDITRTTTDDGNKLGLNEVTGTPGFDYQFVFESIPGALTSFRFRMNGYYEGNPAHTVLAQAWNYTLSSWVSLGVLLDDSSDQTYLFPTIPASDYVSGGQAKIRFLHATAGAAGHLLRVDQLIIENMGADVTTAVPTTAVPTTAPPTVVPTTTLTTPVPTSPVPPTTVPPTTIIVTTPVPTTMLTTTVPTTPPPHVGANDVWFNCKGNNYQGILIIPITITGHSLSASYGLDDFELSIKITITGQSPCAALYAMEPLELAIETSIEGWGVANAQKTNWVGWSKIGDVSFVLDLVNDAGFRPMSWTGYVYQVKKLDKNAIIYGSGGVTVAFPVKDPMPTFGFKELSNVGVKNKTAVGGDEFVHFWIDRLGCLFKLTTEGVTRLGFEEFLRDLVNPVLTWDASLQRLHISDADVGYMYNDSALTGGYASLTGLYRVDTTQTGISPDEIVTLPVSICTDIIDFERRGLKSIEDFQTDAISEIPLFGAIDYRYDKKEDFRTTKWSPMNKEGVVHLRTAGVEFRIRLKGSDNGTFDLTYIKVHFKYIDQRFTRDEVSKYVREPKVY